MVHVVLASSIAFGGRPRARRCLLWRQCWEDIRRVAAYLSTMLKKCAPSFAALQVRTRPGLFVFCLYIILLTFLRWSMHFFTVYHLFVWVCCRLLCSYLPIYLPFPPLPCPPLSLTHYPGGAILQRSLWKIGTASPRRCRSWFAVRASKTVHCSHPSKFWRKSYPGRYLDDR